MGLLRVNPFLGRRSKIGSSIRHRRVKGGCVLSLGFGLRLRGLVGLLRRHECLVAVRRVLAIQLRLRLVLLGVVALLLLIPPRLLFVRPFSSISLLSIQNLTVEVDSLGQFILHFHQHFCGIVNAALLRHNRRLRCFVLFSSTFLLNLPPTVLACSANTCACGNLLKSRSPYAAI